MDNFVIHYSFKAAEFPNHPPTAQADIILWIRSEMINETLVFLKNSLNAYLNSGGKPHDPQEDQVVFLVGQNTDSLSFKLGAISIVLINIERENVLHAPNLYQRTMLDGTLRKVQPDIRLNLYVLFVAHYQQYEDSLRNLSAIIQYFQNHRLITEQDSPDLDESIDQLVIELHTPSFSEQNELWGSLRAHYHPSVLYKIKTLIFEDQTATGMPGIEEDDYRFSQ